MDSNFLAVVGGPRSRFGRKASDNSPNLLLDPKSTKSMRRSADNSVVSSNQSIDQEHPLPLTKNKSEDKLLNNKQRPLVKKSTLESYEDPDINPPSRNNISHSNFDNTMDSKQPRGLEHREKSKISNSTYSNNDLSRVASNPNDLTRNQSNMVDIRTPSNGKNFLSPKEEKFKVKVNGIEKSSHKKAHLEEMSLTNIYSSGNSASLIYIPENFVKSTPSHRQYLFASFNDLTRKEKTTDMELLDKIIQAENAHQFVHHDELTEQNRVGLLSKKLEFNRHQKEAYKKAIDEKIQSTYLPLIKNENAAKEKLARMPKIRAYPSKRMMIQSMTSHHHVDNKQDDMPEIVDLQSQKAEFGQTISSHENLTYSYQFFWYFQEKDNSNWKPSGRESGTLTTVGRHIVLYGGLSNLENDEIVVYDPIKKSWNKPKMTGEMPFYGRHGHTALEYKKSVIFFGGEKKYNENISLRECLNDTRSYNPEKNEWKFFKCMGKVIEPRRNHTAAIQDRMMYIYGGISSHGRYLNDLWSLNLSKKKLVSQADTNITKFRKFHLERGSMRKRRRRKRDRVSYNVSGF